MIEKIILNYLQPHISAYLEVPKNNLPNRFVVIEKTGSSKENMVESATVAIQSYASTLAEAAELNEVVKNLMDSIENLSTLGGCDLNSDYYYPDTTTKKYRYQAVYDITLQ